MFGVFLAIVWFHNLKSDGKLDQKGDNKYVGCRKFDKYILNESKIRPLETTLAGLGSYMSW